MKFICLLLILLFTSCSLGYVRDVHELGNVKSKQETKFIDQLRDKVRGKLFVWYFDEFEVILSEPQEFGNVLFPDESRVFFDRNGSFKRGQMPNGKIACDTGEVANPKVKMLFKNNCFLPSDSNYGDYKYSILPRNFPKEITNEDFLIKVNILFACKGEVEAIAVRDVLVSGRKLVAGDSVIIKLNKIWKIKNEVVNPELNKDICVFLRSDNYSLEY